MRISLEMNSGEGDVIIGETDWKFVTRSSCLLAVARGGPKKKYKVKARKRGEIKLGVKKVDCNIAIK